MKKVVLITAAGLAAVIGFALLWIKQDMNRQLHSPLELEKEEVLIIEPGMSLSAVSHKLVALGWLEQPYYLIYEGRRQHKAKAIKVGEYAVEPGTTPLQLLHKLISGKVIQYPLTIPEGMTARQIIDLVRNHPPLVRTLPDDEMQAVMAALGHPGQNAEGRFFPDTYHFPRGTTDVDFLRRAYRAMESVLNEEWQQRDLGLPYKDPYQALIMASIVEKETAIPEERGRIAGVFVRRLQKGMKLQTDPTVIYALGESYDGNIRKKDLSVDSPYNTYVHAGLPPTPIACPGRDAIRAALQPESGTELYFVARGDGSHHFSSTLAEHNRAVQQYQLNHHR